MKLKLLMLVMAGLLLAGCDEEYEDYDDQAMMEEEYDVVDEGQGSVGDYEQSGDAVSFTTHTLTGESVDSADLFANSTLTMVNVWGTFCNPCLSEMPSLGQIAQEYDPADFQMVGVVVDVYEGDSEDKISNALSLVDETQANYTHLLLNNDMYDQFVGSSQSVPTTYFFNENGEILDCVVGAYSYDDWISIIESFYEQ